jgi:hypothetical protein
VHLRGIGKGHERDLTFNGKNQKMGAHPVIL